MSLARWKKRMSVRGAVAAAPDLALGGVYLLAWTGGAWPPVALRYLFSLLLMEGVIINSAGFMSYVLIGGSTRSYRALSVLGIGAGFGLVAWRFGEPWLLIAFIMMTVNRMLGVLIGQSPSEGEKEFVVASWLTALLLYAATVFLTFAWGAPQLGAHPGQAVMEGLSRDSRWTAEPSGFLSCGYFYFTLLGLSELTDFAWVKLAVYRVASGVTKL